MRYVEAVIICNFFSQPILMFKPIIGFCVKYFPSYLRKMRNEIFIEKFIFPTRNL